MSQLDAYTVCCLQTTPPYCLNNEELRESIRTVLGMCDWAVRTGYELSTGANPHEGRFAPVKLVAIPEFGFMSSPLASEKDVDTVLGNGLACRIPGPETDLISETARRLDIHIAANLYEFDPDWPDRYFNTSFVVAPSGEVVLKHRKLYIPLGLSIDSSPHDFYTSYVERYGDSLDTFFPVADTEIGRIGFAICTEGWFPENFRALAMNGAEIVIHSNFLEPFYSPPANHCEVLNRAAAINNLLYVVGPNLGSGTVVRPDVPGRERPLRPEYWYAGDSMVVDYNGVIAARTPYPGQSACWATIRINELRRRRQDGWNYLAMLRTELYKHVYTRPVYPADLFERQPWRTVADGLARAPQETIARLREQGTFKDPE